MVPSEPLGQLPDGTPYFAPLGQVPQDPESGRVQCHLCGRWFRALAPGHLRWRTDGAISSTSRPSGFPSIEPSSQRRSEVDIVRS